MFRRRSQRSLKLVSKIFQKHNFVLCGNKVTLDLIAPLKSQLPTFRLLRDVSPKIGFKSTKDPISIFPSFASRFNVKRRGI